ncbi:MAG: NUDIX domain-containing protein [Candidatus Pacebacteria bacterium]|nr:NUDIX domain-containing protein [Candidatus Paceibacterota bacterium]
MDKKPQQIGTVIILLNNKNQILLGKRKNAFKAGLYGLPGGRIDRGENLTDGAKRELREETNLDAEDIRYLSVIKEWQEEKDHDFIHFIFLCKKWSRELQVLEPDKCEGWKWFSLDNLPKDILNGHLAAIESFSDGSSLKDI